MARRPESVTVAPQDVRSWPVRTSVRHHAAYAVRGCLHPAHRGSCPDGSSRPDVRASGARPRALHQGRARSPSGPRCRRPLDRHRDRAQEPMRRRPLDRRCASFDVHRLRDEYRRSPPQRPPHELRRRPQDRRSHARRHSPPRQANATEPRAFLPLQTPGCPRLPRVDASPSLCASHTAGALSRAHSAAQPPMARSDSKVSVKYLGSRSAMVLPSDSRLAGLQPVRQERLARQIPAGTTTPQVSLPSAPQKATTAYPSGTGYRRPGRSAISCRRPHEVLIPSPMRRITRHGGQFVIT